MFGLGRQLVAYRAILQICILLAAALRMSSMACAGEKATPDGTKSGKEAAIVALSPDELDKLVDELGRQKPGSDELKNTIQTLTEQGMPAVRAIERSLGNTAPDFGRIHNAVRVLKGVNTPQTRALLLRMALGEFKIKNPNLQAWAGYALIDCDRAQAWELLESPHVQVLAPALNAVEGQPVTEKRISTLKKVAIEQTSDLAKWRAIEILLHADSGEKANAAGIETIEIALTGVGQLTDANVLKDERHGFHSSYTVAELHYRRYANALGNCGVNSDSLRTLAGKLKGRARDAVFLAIAHRQEKSVHDEMVRIAKDKDAGLFRAWAATGLAEVGTSSDLPLLQTLADSDPLVRTGPLHGTRLHQVGPTYPVRDAAKNAIRALGGKPKTL